MPVSAYTNFTIDKRVKAICKLNKNTIKRKIYRNIFNLGTTCRLACLPPRSRNKAA